MIPTALYSCTAVQLYSCRKFPTRTTVQLYGVLYEYESCRCLADPPPAPSPLSPPLADPSLVTGP
eukprot:COSAG01_NODE_67207_length_267_cov_2.630952_1_plen_64_part_10